MPTPGSLDRKAKELLFPGDASTARQAEQLGMVNRVVPLRELVPTVMTLARRITRHDAFALRMAAKRAVNHTPRQASARVIDDDLGAPGRE